MQNMNGLSAYSQLTPEQRRTCDDAVRSDTVIRLTTSPRTVQKFGIRTIHLENAHAIQEKREENARKMLDGIADMSPIPRQEVLCESAGQGGIQDAGALADLELHKPLTGFNSARSSAVVLSDFMDKVLISTSLLIAEQNAAARDAEGIKSVE